MNTSEIARVCHEANRALQQIQNDPTIPVSPPWEKLGREMVRSIESGVLGILDGNTPEQSHQSWIDFKLSHGWKWGPVKDEVAKEHPLLVPYEELPEQQKLKDHLFSAIVLALGGAPQ